MKSCFLISLVLPTLLLSDNTNEEIASIIKNDEVYTFEDLKLLKTDFIHFTRDLLDNQSNVISAILYQNKDAILQRMTAIASQNIQQLKSEIGSLVSEKFDLFANTFSPSLQADASEQHSLPVTDNTLPATDNSLPVSSRRTDPAIKQGSNGLRPPFISGSGLSVGGDFLWWTVGQEASEFVAGPVTIPVAQQAVNYDTLGAYRSAQFNWNPGFRFNLGYTFERDIWQLFGEYTFYQTDGKTVLTRREDGVSFIFATFSDIPFVPGLMKAISKINFWYNTADLMLARRFLISKQIFLKFAIGATAAWIKEKWSITYRGIDSTFVVNNWHYSSGGVRAKIDSCWHLGGGFGIFGNLSGAALLGNYYNKNEVNLSNPAAAGHFNPTRDTTYRNHIIIPMTRFAFGLDWNGIYDSFAAKIAVGVEANTWFDLHQVYKDTLNTQPLANNRVDLRNTANVNLYGLTAELAFDF